MKKITLSELETLNVERAPHRIIFDTDNFLPLAFPAIRASLSFDAMQIVNYPEMKMICLKSSAGTICINSILNITIKEYEAGWSVVSISCAHDSKSISYTLILDY